MAVAIERPTASEYAPFYSGYVAAVPEGHLLDVLAEQGRDLEAALRTVPESRASFRYAQGKWSVREVLAHVTDAERVFAYRALHFARASGTPLPPFDENAWVDIAGADRRPLPEHIAEFAAVRAATIALLGGFREEDFARTGIASGHPISVRALAWIIAGHERHHLRILREKYGV